MENKTAEDFLKPTRGYMGTIPAYDVEEAMIQFAQYHVQKALEAATESADTIVVTESDGYETWENTKVDDNSILYAYPLENIK